MGDCSLKLINLINTYTLFFAWDDQSEKVYCVVHKVLINYSCTALAIQYSYALDWAYTVLLCH